MKKLTVSLLVVLCAFSAFSADFFDTVEPITVGEESFVQRLNEGTDNPIGLVLTGGSARGFAHMGVLKYFEEHNIVPDYIVANSMGGIVGLFYASGMTGDQMVRFLEEVEMGSFFDITLPISRGLLDSTKLCDLICTYIGYDRLEDLPIPLMLVTEDLVTKRQVNFCSGDLRTILKATFAMPIFFASVEMDDYVLLDGGTLDVTTLDTAYKYSDTVILSSTFNSVKPGNYKSIFSAVDVPLGISKDRNAAEDLIKYPNTRWIRCDVENYPFTSFNLGSELAQDGYRSAAESRQVLDGLKSTKTRKSVDFKLSEAYAKWSHVTLTTPYFVPAVTGRSYKNTEYSDFFLGIGARCYNKDLVAEISLGLDSNVSDSYFAKPVVNANLEYVKNSLKTVFDFRYWVKDKAFAINQSAMYLTDSGLMIKEEYQTDLSEHKVSLGVEKTLTVGSVDVKFEGGFTDYVKQYITPYIDVKLEDGRLFDAWTVQVQGYCEILSKRITTNAFIGRRVGKDLSIANIITFDNFKLGIYEKSYNKSYLEAGLEARGSLGLMGLRNFPFSIRAGYSLSSKEAKFELCFED